MGDVPACNSDTRTQSESTYFWILGPATVEEAHYEAEVDQSRPRRSLIKFAGFEDEVEEPPPASTTATAEASQVNRTARPSGLLRAPTPYPKELRALAKHASQIYSNTRQGNGEVVTTVRNL